uniref:Tox-SGS domain-containing protein n=1 Tax=Anopheles minimus TaxID=112268 RepID=A0A182W8Z9_9DIPT
MDASEKFYSLKLPGKSLIKIPPSNTVEAKRESIAGKTIFVRNNRMLVIYEETNGSLSQVHKAADFFSVDNDDINYPWTVFEGGVLAVRKINGIIVYKWSKPMLKRLHVVLKYHDEYGYGLQNNTIVFGKIFPFEEHIGVVSRLGSTVEFGSINPSASVKAVRSLKKLNLDPEWKLPSSDILLVARYDNKTQLAVALRTASELKLFRFDNNYKLKELATVNDFHPRDNEYDRIMFAKFDNGSTNDLLLFSSQGLTMYRLNEESGRFEKVYYSTAFSKLRGWTKRIIDTIATIDIDGDNRDELIASGPKGLSVYRPVFTDDGFDLVNIFDYTIEDRIVRYGLPKLTMKRTDSVGFNILLFTGENLLEVQTTPFTSQSYEIPSFEPSITHSNTKVPLLVPQKKYIVWLHDQLDLNSMLQPLNPHAGTVELSIPLVELPNAFGVSVRKYLQYKNIPFESFFGRGWSLPLDYISVERKNSGFLQDHDYAILKNNNRILLKRKPAWDSIKHWAFIIEGYKQAMVKYYPTTEHWELTMEDRTFVYGTWNNLTMKREEGVCSTWPLCGSKSPKTQNLPSRWYLVHEESKYGPYANYYYDTFVQEKGDRLARIELNSGSSVRFKYSDKNQLLSFTVNTTCYEQNVSFEYTGNSLTHIKQEDRTLFKFEYKDQRMSKIVYPNQLESSLEYSDMEIDRTHFEEEVPVDLSPTMYYGPDYTVILDKEYEDDRVVISIRNLLGGTEGPKVTKEKLHFGQPGIKSHTIHALEDMLVIVLIYSSRKEVTILQFTNNEWVEKEYHPDFPLDAVIDVGRKFVVVYNLKTVRVLTISHDGKLISTDVKKSVPSKFLIHTFANGFVTYDTYIDVWTMGLKNQWKKGYTSTPTDVFADIEQVLNVFELSSEFRAALRKGFLADAVTVYQNAVVLRVPALADKKLELKVYFVIMKLEPDRGARTVSEQSVRIPIANFNTYEYDLPTKDGDVFKLFYEERNKKLLLNVKSLQGPLYTSLMDQQKKSYKQIDDSKENATKKKQYKKEVDEKIAEELDNVKRTVVEKVQFAMDLSQFGVLTNQHGIVTGNRQLSFDGQTWQQEHISPETMRMEKVDQLLGQGFKLAKNNHEDTFKVYEMPGNVMVYNTQTNNPQEIQIVAPRYIQSQPAGQRLTMFIFQTKETVQLPANETMVRASNTIALVTVRHVNETCKFVIFRPVDSFLLKKTTLFTKQNVRLNGDETRTTTHMYDARDAHLSSEGAMFYRVEVAPGGDTRKFGWYEQATNASTGATTKKSYAFDGTDVTVREKPKRNRPDTKDIERTIWDRSRQQKVVELGALKLADEVASYYGFEPYELNRYGIDNEWKFDEKDVQNEQENHFLKLTARSALKATFTPDQPSNMWIVSFWVRLRPVPKVNDLLNVVQVAVVNLADNSRQTVSGARVLHKTSNWCYVEMTIDTTKSARPTKLRFDISIDPSALGKSIDVDHVRFSPMDMNFLASIYTPVNAEVRATLHNNGRLKQSLYSPNGRRVALLSENGQVIDFAMHSKTAYVASINAMQSLVEMKPNFGVYEKFDKTHWKPSGEQWSINHGELEHNPGNTGKRGEIIRTFDRPFESLALRFLYNFASDDAKLDFSWNGQEYVIIGSGAAACNRPPRVGEVLIFITELRISVWLEGHLCTETLLSGVAKRKVFRLLSTGSLVISEFLAMYDARVKVTYYNRMGRPVQFVVYDDPRTVRVRELAYDEIDRPIMQTKWTKLTNNDKNYFAFYENFITQVHGTSHVMSGLVAKAHPSCEGFPYSSTVYANDPTENKKFQGLPGKDYSVLGKYKRRYAMRPEISLLETMFPEANGYRQRIVERSGGAIRATVEDKLGNKVAKYWQVGNFEHRLTTYVYSDTYGHLIQMMPPQYHALAKTTGGNIQKEIELKHQWRVSYYYEDGNLIGKRTTDGGSFEYVYTESGILRYSLHYNSPERKNLDRVIHFTYSSHGKVMREALVNMTREQCYHLVETNEVPASNDLIESFYGEIETNPDIRYRSQQSTRTIGKNQMIESLIFNENEKVIKKVFVVPTINSTYSIDYEYENGKLRSLQYPMNSTTTSFMLIYDYNGTGDIKSIRESTRRDPMFEFTYNADGMMETMKVRTDGKHMFQRNFTYNEPGFLVQLNDEYLSESVSYLETDSYGQDSYTPIYEGLISKTLFTAHWRNMTSPLRNGIFPESVISEKYYLRDANGLVLMDMDMTYLAKDQPPDVRVTSYIYKDQQLIGFLRNDKLYGVITDHEGSVRLVVTGGEVVAAYDYLPYGQIFRRFGTDLDGQLSYLYTGQEWEPETGLYNYRARLYDPDIGRFYQMDPKEQYPSPYVYAGNSPVSLVDPDGEFAFTLAVLILALVGAYLGAASANNCWNPLKWDWRSSSTWIGLLTGAVTGASIPFNMSSSVAFFVGMGLSLSTSIAIMVGTGITFAYFMMAASSGTWDPTKFDYSSPGTWNALMNGVATSSWILMNPSSLISSFVSITSVAAKALFFVAKLTMSLGFTYLFAALGQGVEFDVTKWDFSDPQLYMSIVDGFTTATVGVLFLRNLPNQVSKWTGKVKRTVDLFVGNLITFRAHLALGRDWSRVIMHSRNFLYVSYRNMQSLQKGFLTVGFYSLIVSLRMSEVPSSAIPEFTASEAAINVLFTTEQFSDFIVKPLATASPQLRLPKPPNIARFLRFRIRSEAISIGNDSHLHSQHTQRSSSSSLRSTFDAFIKLPFEWLFRSNIDETKSTTYTTSSVATYAPKQMPRAGYMLRNCYKMRNEQHPDGMVSCYGHNSVLTIVPKFSDAKIAEMDHYNFCMPLTYDGHPSVSCQGEWSSLVYTAKDTARVFDLVDGWILLAQVAPSAYREIKRGIKYLFSRPERNTPHLNKERVENEREMLMSRLDDLKSQIHIHKRAQHWAKWTIEDLTEDVEVYLATGQGSLSLLEDRISTLAAEIDEDIIIQKVQSTFRAQEGKENSFVSSENLHSGATSSNWKILFELDTTKSTSCGQSFNLSKRPATFCVTVFSFGDMDKPKLAPSIAAHTVAGLLQSHSQNRKLPSLALLPLYSRNPPVVPLVTITNAIRDKPVNPTKALWTAPTALNSVAPVSAPVNKAFHVPGWVQSQLLGSQLPVADAILT